MKTAAITTLIILGPVFLIAFAIFYIREKYRKYDEEKTLEETIEQNREMIKGALLYFNDKYNQDFDSTSHIYKTIKLKTDFIKDLIIKYPIYKQPRLYEKLYAMLYETEKRLIENRDNVQAIIKPLNNLTNELISEKIDYLKENI